MSVATLKDYTTICPAAPSEVLALVALRASGPLLARSRGIIATGLAATREMVHSVPEHVEWAEPSAGTFAFVRLRGVRPGESTEAYCDALRRRANLMLMPGALFELDDTPEAGDAAQRVRVTYGRRVTVPLLGRWADDLRRCGVAT